MHCSLEPVHEFFFFFLLYVMQNVAKTLMLKCLEIEGDMQVTT